MTTAAIVGSGPNGLAAAVTLALAGVEVTVYESSDRLGGGARSAELTVPGVLHDECSGFHPLGVDTAFSQLASLELHGLTWLWPEVEFTSPLDSTGRGGSAVRSSQITADLLDDATWGRVFGALADRFDTITDDFLQPMVRRPRHPIHLARFGLSAALPASLLARRFSNPEAKSLWAGVAAHAFRPFGSPFSSAIGVALASAAHRFGWPVAEGGSQKITDAMARVIVANGGRLETGARIEQLASVAHHDVVMLDLTPNAAVHFAGDAMPAKIARDYLRYRHGPGAFKVDFAVDGGVPWLHEPSTRAGTVHVCGSYEEVADAELAVNRGRMPSRPFVLVGQQAVADPSRASGDVQPIYSYAHVPAGYSGDATEAITAQIERFAPGFRQRIVASHVRSTTELSRHNVNYIGGDIVTGSNDFRQLIFRPRVTTDPYATGIDGVFLCSAATPPGAGAHGMCGYNAARRALRDL